MSFFNKIKQAIPKKALMWILGILLLLGGWIFLRSCSVEHMGKKRTYVIARDSTWYPDQLLGKERNLQAFMNDLFTAIAQEMHLRFHWVEINAANLTDGLHSGNYDAIVSSLKPSFINQNKYLFSNLLYSLGPILIVNQQSSATSLADMQKKTIGIPPGFNLNFTTIKKSGANAYDFFVVIYDNMNKALEALEKNQIDGIIMQALPAYTYIEGFYLNKVKVITPPLNDQGLRMISLNDPSMVEFFEEFNKVLDEIKKNGTYKLLTEKWNLIDPEMLYLKNFPKTK